MSQTLSGALVAALRAQIVDGEIAPGQRLPSEPLLAAEHGVSRTVVREAVARLNLEGLVHTRRGSGSYALAPPAGADDEPVARSLDDRLALVDYRVGVETQAAALAAARRTPAQLDALEGSLGQLAESRGRPATAMQHDFAFHRLVAEAARNRFLLEALDRLGPQMIAMPRGRLAGSDVDDGDGGGVPARLATVVQEHQTVLDAIADQDPRAAAAAMRVHLAGSRRRLLAESGAARD